MDAESVRVVTDETLDFVDDRDGLISCWLFLRDLVPDAPVDAALAVPVRRGGRVGEESREAKGVPAADVEAEAVVEAGATCLLWSVSAFRSEANFRSWR